MKIKRFTAPDTRQALRLVREELGPDAVVLSSRSSEEGAEVIVAIDYDEKSVAKLAEQARPDEPGPQAMPSNDGRGGGEGLPHPSSLQREEGVHVGHAMGDFRHGEPPANPRARDDQALQTSGEHANLRHSAMSPPVERNERYFRPGAAVPPQKRSEPTFPPGWLRPSEEDVGPHARPTRDMPTQKQSELHSRPSTAAPAEEHREPNFRSNRVLPIDEHDEPLEGLGGELRRLRATLEHQLRYLRKQDPDPVREEVLSLLEQIGIGPALAEGITTRIMRGGAAPEHAWSAARLALAEQIPATENDVVHSGGVMALIGPTGVGKTTTIAKLAARFALKHGRKHVALVTTDVHRIGAQEQLSSFGQTLGIKVDAASNRVELRQLLEHHRDKKLVLVDNAGFGQRDLRLAAQLADLDSIPFLSTYLVVSTTVQSAGLDEVFSAFGRTRLHGCILTKLDEAVSLGAVIQTLAHYRLPIAYTCTGQRIPEDIQPASSEGLLARAEGLAQTGAPRFAPEDNYYSRRLVANGLA